MARDRQSPPQDKPQAMPSPARIQQRLMNKAVHYLGRYAASQVKLEEVLRRFAMRKLPQVGPADLQAPLQAVIEKCVSLGYIDDSAFARTKWRSGLAAGRSPRFLSQKLRQAGIDQSIIQTLLHEGEDDAVSDPVFTEMQAALVMARKRRLGPYCPAPPSEFSEKQKQMAKLVRAGFSLDICRQLMEFPGPEEAESWLDRHKPDFYR